MLLKEQEVTSLQREEKIIEKEKDRIHKQGSFSKMYHYWTWKCGFSEKPETKIFNQEAEFKIKKKILKKLFKI